MQQVSLVDSRGIGSAGPRRNADRGVVQVRRAESDGPGTPIGDWVRIEAFQNNYDTQAGDQYFNCFSEPVDDGNQEDDFFDPTDPYRGLNGTLGGPSSTCSPEYTYSCIGDTQMVTSGDTTTDRIFSLANVCDADTANASTVLPGANPIRNGNPITTWVQSKYDLSAFRGQRLRLRFLVATLKIGNPDWRAQFGANVGARDDGWWIDAIEVDETLVDPATLVVDPAPNTGLPGCGPTCTTVTANVVASPGGTNPPSVTLAAPGQVVEFDASNSTADACLSGALQFRYLRDGAPVRGWSADPTLLAAPDGPSTYTAEVRCSTATGCLGQRAVLVDVGCPASGNLRRFPEITATKAGAGPQPARFAWTPFPSGAPLSWEAVRGDLSAVGSLLVTSLEAGADADFEDGTAPSPGAGY